MTHFFIVCFFTSSSSFTVIVITVLVYLVLVLRYLVLVLTLVVLVLALVLGDMVLITFLVAAHSLSLQSNLNPVYNLRPLNSPTNYLVIYLFTITYVNNASPSLHVHTSPLFQVELEKDDWE